LILSVVSLPCKLSLNIHVASESLHHPITYAQLGDLGYTGKRTRSEEGVKNLALFPFHIIHAVVPDSNIASILPSPPK
jgi:hypothetical protein